MVVFIRTSCCALGTESSYNLTAVKGLLMSVCRGFCQGFNHGSGRTERTRVDRLIAASFADSGGATILRGVILFALMLTR